MKKLTIAIPTYNRNETLNECLIRLLPQLNDHCQLTILDDNSLHPVSDSTAKVLARFPAVDIEVRRNRWNIGLVANVLRCFEYCNTEWIWVPGDDDLFLSDAIEKIFEATEENPEALYINFATQNVRESGARKMTTVARGIEGFARALDLVGLVNFMSCSIWKTEEVGKYLSSGFYNAYSNGWTFALLLNALGDTGQVVFSNVAVIGTITTAPVATRWSHRKFILGWPTLLEIPASKAVRNILAKKMLGFYSPENVTAYMLADAATRPWPDRFFYYDLAVGRLSAYHVHRFGRLRFALYRPLFAVPKIGWKLVSSLIAAANWLGMKSIDIGDMEGRGNS